MSAVVWLGGAVVLGLSTGWGSLSYQPEGRINLLLVWWLWAGLPALGSLASLLLVLFKPSRIRDLSWLRWLPNASSVPFARLAAQLQLFWLVFGLSLLAVLATLLLFSDLAFAWSSTLLEPAAMHQILSGLAWPWRGWWPQAVPSLELVEQTRYLRIAPLAAEAEAFGHWWPFILASTLTYNLLPRLLLWLGLRGSAVDRPSVTGFIRPAAQTAVPLPALSERTGVLPASTLLCQWRLTPLQAEQLPAAMARCELGWHSYEQDEQQIRQAPTAECWCWCVGAERTPIAELADLIAQARAAGVAQHWLYCLDGEGPTALQRLSWQQFCQREQLDWYQPTLGSENPQ